MANSEIDITKVHDEFVVNGSIGIYKHETARCLAKDTENGLTVYLIPQIMNWRVASGRKDDLNGYDKAFCFTTMAVAVEAFVRWDGEGDPIDGWVRSIRDDRRRPDGKPESEYIGK